MNGVRSKEETMDEKPKINSTPKPDKEFLIRLIISIASASGVELTDMRIQIYSAALSKFQPKYLMRAANRTILEWNEASKMAPLPFIIERVEEAILEDRMNQPALPEHKPDPGTSEQFQEMLKKAGLQEWPK